MKLTLALLLTLTAAVARAELLRPINSRQKADVNGRVIETKELRPGLVPGRAYSTTRSPLSDKVVTSTTVPIVNVAPAATIERRTLRQEQRHYRTVPQQNFTTRRAAQADKPRQADKTFVTGSAPVKDRVIHATTPAGEAELVEQLKKLQTR
jgi:hypothetical protein